MEVESTQLEVQKLKKEKHFFYIQQTTTVTIFLKKLHQTPAWKNRGKQKEQASSNGSQQNQRKSQSTETKENERNNQKNRKTDQGSLSETKYTF